MYVSGVRGISIHRKVNVTGKKYPVKLIITIARRGEKERTPHPGESFWTPGSESVQSMIERMFLVMTELSMATHWATTGFWIASLLCRYDDYENRLMMTLIQPRG